MLVGSCVHPEQLRLSFTKFLKKTYLAVRVINLLQATEIQNDWINT